MKSILNKLLIVLLFLCWSFFVLTQAVFAVETTITIANVNNEEFYDIEIMQNGENFLLPTKQIADILDINLKINHSTKEIFLKDFTLSKNSVFHNGKKISNSQYLQKGMMEDIKDEIFCDCKTLSKIFDTPIELNKNDLSIFITTNRKVKQNEIITEEKTLQKDNFDIIQPNQKGQFSLDTVQFDNSMMSDNAALIYKTSINKTSIFNNSGRLKLKGMLYQGEYEADLSGNNYKGELFSFSGLNFKYSKDFKEKHYEFGKISGFNDDDYQFGNQVLGLQVFNSNLKNKYSGYIGISGFNDRLFSSNGYLYQMNTKKLTIGLRQEKKIKENLTSDTKILYDKIISIPNETIWAQNFYNNNSILTMGNFKNPNTIEGATILNTLKYKLNENWDLKSNLAFSTSKDKQNLSNGNFGYDFSLNSIYDKNNFSLNLELYNQSPNFYLASSQFGFVSDRLGGKITAQYNYKNLNSSLKYNKYISNTQKKYDGGIINFDEINFNLSGRIKNIAQGKYNFSGRKGVNDFGENVSYYQDFSLSKYFKKGISLELGRQQNFYSNKFYKDLSQNNFSSIYCTDYIKTGFDIPKNKGHLDFAHEQVKTDLSKVKNNYNIIKVNYTFPEMKRILLSLGIGYKYKGNENGLNYNATLGYRTKSGMIMSLGYRYETNNGYIFDNIYIPTSQRHSINFTINDTFALMPSGLKSIGQMEDTKGFVEVVTYLDTNNNGIYDKEDIGVQDVPIKFSFQDEILYTNKNGKIPVKTADKGVYFVSVDIEKLDGNLSIKRGDKQRQMILIEPKKQTKVAFKLTSSVGNIKGNLKIVDDFNRVKSTKDFIVVIHNEKGEEVAYSTVDNMGNYNFSGLEPGKYTISLDENFIKEYNLEPFDKKETLKVEIPYIYKKFVDLENMNLIYKSW